MAKLYQSRLVILTVEIVENVDGTLVFHVRNEGPLKI